MKKAVLPPALIVVASAIYFVIASVALAMTPVSFTVEKNKYTQTSPVSPDFLCKNSLSPSK